MALQKNSAHVNAATSKPSLTYSAHVQTFGWPEQTESANKVATAAELNTKPTTTDVLAVPDSFAGTMKLSKRVEALRINLAGVGNDVTIKYSVHQQNFGWSNWVSNGEVAGVTNKQKRAEAVAISVEGLDKYGYDLYYRAHVQNFGWLEWVKATEEQPNLTNTKGKNTGYAGTVGYSKRLEAIEIALVKTEVTPESVADVVTNFNNWLKNESGLENYVYGTYTKYSKIADFKTIIDKAKTDLESATTIADAEKIVSTAKENLLSKVQEYTLAELKKAYEDGNNKDFVLTDEQYGIVVKAIDSASSISNVINLFDNAMEGRMTKNEYDFLAAKTNAKNNIDAYVRTKNSALGNNSLDDALLAELDRVVTKAKNDIDNVAVRYEDYATATTNITSLETQAKASIDTIYTLVSTKASGATDVQTSYNNGIKALEGMLTGDELVAAKAELTKLLEAGKTAMAETITNETYINAKNATLTSMRTYITLMTAKNTAKGELKTAYEGHIDAIKEQAGAVNYTDKEAKKLLDTYNAGLKAIDAATIVADVEGSSEVSVNKAKTDALAELTKARGVCISTALSRKTIKEYVADLDTNIPTSTTTKYISGVQTAIDAEYAELDKQLDTKTQEEIMAYRDTAKANIFEATKTYLANLLNEMAKLTINSSTTKVLSLECYEGLADNLKALKENTSSNDLETLISTFEGYATLKTQTELAGEMDSAWKSDERYTKLSRGQGISGTYGNLPKVVTALANIKFDTVKSAKEYKTIVDNAEPSIVEALRVELKAKLEEKGKDVTLEFNRASTIVGIITAYETAESAE